MPSPPSSRLGRDRLRGPRPIVEPSKIFAARPRARGVFMILRYRHVAFPYHGEICTMKRPSKTAAELEASIKVEMEDICYWPTDITISVQPDGDSWKVASCKRDPQTTPIVAKWSSRSLRGSKRNMI